MGFPQKQLADGESVVLFLRPHGKVLVRPVLALVLVVALFGAGVWLATWPLLDYALLAVGAGLALKFTGGPVLKWWTTTYVVTTERLIIRTGVLTRSGHDMPLVRLNDISFSHGLLDRMVGCGTLVVESAGEEGQIRLEDIPRVETVQRTLYQLSDDAREQDGQTVVVVDADDPEDVDELGDLLERARRERAGRERARGASAVETEADGRDDPQALPGPRA